MPRCRDAAPTSASIRSYFIAIVSNEISKIDTVTRSTPREGIANVFRYRATRRSVSATPLPLFQPCRRLRYGRVSRSGEIPKTVLDTEYWQRSPVRTPAATIDLVNEKRLVLSRGKLHRVVTARLSNAKERIVGNCTEIMEIPWSLDGEKRD